MVVSMNKVTADESSQYDNKTSWNDIFYYRTCMMDMFPLSAQIGTFLLTVAKAPVEKVEIFSISYFRLFMYVR